MAGWLVGWLVGGMYCSVVYAKRSIHSRVHSSYCLPKCWEFITTKYAKHATWFLCKFACSMCIYICKKNPAEFARIPTVLWLFLPLNIFSLVQRFAKHIRCFAQSKKDWRIRQFSWVESKQFLHTKVLKIKIDVRPWKMFRVLSPYCYFLIVWLSK